MKCLFLSLQQLLQLFGALRSKMTVFFIRKWPLPAWGETNLLGLYDVNSDEEATAPFSVHFAPCPPSPSAECQVSLGLCFFSFLLFDFHVDVISSCVSGSHCLCLTGRLNVFLKTTDTATGCHVEKRKKKSAVSMERGRERKKSSSYRLAPSPLPLVKVCMCVYMCVSVRVWFFLCQ